MTLTPSATDDLMLLRKHTLQPLTQQAFGLRRDPFSDVLEGPEEVFLDATVRYVRDAMLTTANVGGLLAITGESGAGKTLLIEDLEDRIHREGLPIVVIRPYVLAMEDNDARGKTLRATHIAEAILTRVAPTAKLASSPQARFDQMHRVLQASAQAGQRHVVLIDEAHALPVATLKHLKRFFELKLGFAKVLSIILLGQPELAIKLSERNAEVREVVQRCERIDLPPLEGERLEAYLRFRLERQGHTLDALIDSSGLAAMRERLTWQVSRRPQTESSSLLYPLGVGNLLVAALNRAAELGMPKVTADVVRAV